MTLGSFGRELSAGTFSFLLAQPVSRSRVWWTKTLLLAAAAGTHLGGVVVFLEPQHELPGAGAKDGARPS